MTDGMEAAIAAEKAERDAVFLHGLPTRVKHLESVVDTMHRDSLMMQGSLTGLSSQVNAIAETLKDFGSKLDTQRTQRPDWGTLAAWAGVLLVVGAMAFVPVRDNLEVFRSDLHDINEAAVENAYRMGQNDARLSALERIEAARMSQ